MSNVEGMYSVYFILEGLSKAKPPFKILRFDIRYSAVHCSATWSPILIPDPNNG
jgi:hypothetical protein